MIYTKDHSPAHIHVLGPGCEAKFALGSWEVLENRGFDERTVSRIREFLKPLNSEFMEVWNAFQQEEKY